MAKTSAGLTNRSRRMWPTHMVTASISLPLPTLSPPPSPPLNKLGRERGEGDPTPIFLVPLC